MTKEWKQNVSVLLFYSLTPLLTQTNGGRGWPAKRYIDMMSQCGEHNGGGHWAMRDHLYIPSPKNVLQSTCCHLMLWDDWARPHHLSSRLVHHLATICGNDRWLHGCHISEVAKKFTFWYKVMCISHTQCPLTPLPHHMIEVNEYILHWGLWLDCMWLSMGKWSKWCWQECVKVTTSLPTIPKSAQYWLSPLQHVHCNICHSMTQYALWSWRWWGQRDMLVCKKLTFLCR